MKSIFLGTLFIAASQPAFALEQMSNQELRSITGQQIIEMPSLDGQNFALTVEGYDTNDTVEDLIIDSFDSLADATGLSFDFEIRGVQFGNSPASTLNAETQALTLAGPESIEFIGLHNLRAGENSPEIGSLTIHDIHFDTLNVVITPR